MKKILMWTMFICVSASPLFASPVSPAAVIDPPTKIVPNEVLLKKISSLKIKDLQKLAGRKFTLKEKIAFWILKQKLKHPAKAREGSSQGQTAMVFGIVAVGLLVAGLFLPYVIIGSLVSAILAIVLGSVAKKKDPSDRKAHAGKLLGWITLGLIAFLFVLAAIVIASWSWSWG